MSSGRTRSAFACTASRNCLRSLPTCWRARDFAQAQTRSPQILDIRFTSPTTAAVWSDEQIKGLVNDYSGKPMQPRHSYYLDVLVKKDGAWKISDEIVMDQIHVQ